MALKRCKTTFFVFFDGTPEPVHEGDLVDEDDDLYKARPEAFEDLKPTRWRGRVRSQIRDELPPVEQATAAPGEKRSTRRSSKGSSKS